MSWLDKIDIGHDLQICPDCQQEYQVLDQFLGSTTADTWIDAVVNDKYYVELRCPQCLETRYLYLQALTANQFYTEKEKK